MEKYTKMSKKNEEVSWYVEEKKETCAACGSTEDLTLHHLIPQSRCKSKYKQDKDDPSNHVMLCRSCHSQVHALYDESTLRDLYSSLDALLNAPEFSKYVAWKKKHPEFTGSSKMSKDRKGKLKR